MTFRTFGIALPTMGLVALMAGPAAAQIPVEYHGDWVQAQAACTATLRFRVEPARMTLINGADTEAVGEIELAHSFFGPDYKGIQLVVISEFSGDQGVTAVFNYEEKRGATWLELAQPTANPNPKNTVAIATNARLAKRNLVKRFPLHRVTLKKCPAATGSPAPRR